MTGYVSCTSGRNSPSWSTPGSGTTTGTIRSRRVTEELRELACYAAAHPHLDEVAHLRRRIATAVCIEGSFPVSPG